MSKKKNSTKNARKTEQKKIGQINDGINASGIHQFPVDYTIGNSFPYMLHVSKQTEIKKTVGLSQGSNWTF